MKKILVLVMLMASRCFGAAATVTTYAEFKTAVGAGNTPIYLNADTFTMDADTTIAYSCAISVLSTHTGNVTFEGGTDYQLIFDDASATTAISVTGSASKRIIFNQFEDGVYVKSSHNNTLGVSFAYCNFVGSNANTVGANGLQVTGDAVGTATVTATNCKAYNNAGDGFSLQSTGATITKPTIMILIDCDSYWNDNVDNVGSGGGGGAGDGATLHENNEYLYVYGGNYYQNGKSGFSQIDGSLYIDGANIYGNGVVVHTNGDIFSGTASDYLYVNNCIFSQYSSSRFDSGYGHITLGTIASAFITNNLFHSPTLLGAARKIIDNPAGTISNVSIRDNIFSGFVNSTTVIYCADLSNSNPPCEFVGNTVYNCYRGFRSGGKAVFKKNIFHTASTAIYDDYTLGLKYGNNPLNGYNDFYNCTNVSNSATSCTTDLTSDPTFYDTTNFMPTNADCKLTDGTWIGATAPADKGTWQVNF